MGFSFLIDFICEILHVEFCLCLLLNFFFLIFYFSSMSVTFSIPNLSPGMFEVSPPSTHIVVICKFKKPSLYFFVQIIKTKMNDTDSG